MITDPYLGPERFTWPMDDADYPAAPDFPPYRSGSCSTPPYPSRSYSSLPEPDTCPWPDTYGVTWDDQIGIELDELSRIRVPVPETSGDGSIVFRRIKYRCYRCYPSYLASRWYRLPWTFTVSLSAPAGCFEDWWGEAGILHGLMRLAPRGTSVVEILDAPFWIGVFAWQPSTATSPRLLPVQGEIHAHLVVGNVNRELLDQILARWPKQGRFCVVKPVTHAWSAVHYCLSQTRIARQKTGESYARYINRVKTDHQRGHDALADVPFGFETLDLQEIIMRLRRATRVRTPETIAIGLRLAAAKHPIKMMLNGVLHRMPLPLNQDQRTVVKLAVLLNTIQQVQNQEAAA